MGPRNSTFWEFWSLCFWWAAWSLADTYLLPITPFSEIAVLWLCIVIAGAIRLAACLGGVQRYTECLEDTEQPAPPPPAKPANVLVDAV